MKFNLKQLFALLPVLCAPAQLANAAQTAQVHLICGSVRFERGQTGAVAFMELTTIAPAINGELRTDYASGNFTYQADFFLSNSVAGTVVSGSLVLPPPSMADAATNGIPDFFEAAHPVAWTNDLGTFMSSSGTGQLAAAWSRPAGTNTGECWLTFTFDAPALRETYRCPFSILEYAGSLHYQSSSNGVSSPVALNQVCHVTNTLSATMVLTRTANWFHELSLAAGGWTNAAGLTLPYPEVQLSRQLPTTLSFHPSIFAIAYFCEDGNPETVQPDYLNWLLTIDDPNDADGDGIPDLADVYFANPARPPTLAFVTIDTHLFLQLSGDVGRVHEVQEAESLSSTNWQKVASFILAEDPQLLVAPPFSESARFWRAVAR